MRLVAVGALRARVLVPPVVVVVMTVRGVGVLLALVGAVVFG
jgi:hypothetical protein